MQTNARQSDYYHESNIDGIARACIRSYRTHLRNNACGNPRQQRRSTKRLRQRLPCGSAAARAAAARHPSQLRASLGAPRATQIGAAPSRTAWVSEMAFGRATLGAIGTVRPFKQISNLWFALSKYIMELRILSLDGAKFFQLS